MSPRLYRDLLFANTSVGKPKFGVPEDTEVNTFRKVEEE